MKSFTRTLQLSTKQPPRLTLLPGVQLKPHTPRTMSSQNKDSASQPQPTRDSTSQSQTDQNMSPTQPLPLPEPTTTTTTTTIDMSTGGSTVKLDHMGPLVVNKDGTLSRIGNWGEMSEIERANTVRILGKRNMLRREALSREAEAEGGEAGK